ncbi:MAG TPA: peptidylprolyl isomerase [Coriobacteriia bacterium]
MAVNSGDTVRVHYKGTLADGTIFDSSEGREPLAFTVGAGQVIPGFEEAVLALEPGDTAVVTIDPENAYGPRIEALAHTVSVSDFGETPYVGGIVTLTSPEGDELQGHITAVEGDAVSIDFNHPLAGETLIFEIELVDSEPA